MLNPIRFASARWRACRLHRAAAANRDIVYLLMPYPESADARDRCADVAATLEQTAGQLLEEATGHTHRPGGGAAA